MHHCPPMRTLTHLVAAQRPRRALIEGLLSSARRPAIPYAGSLAHAPISGFRLLDTWCCRVASLDVRPAHGLVLRSLFALWPQGISFGPGHRWALELHSRALWYPVSAWLGSWWHEKRRIGASPARVTLIRERAAQSADHLAEKRQKWAVVGEVVCDLGKSRNEANTTTYNSDFPAPHSRQVTTPATRLVQPPSWPQPTKTPTFPHQQAKKSPQNQYVASYNPSVL